MSLTQDEISEQIFVNTLAPLYIVQSMNKESKFVFISSIMQYIPAKNMSVYAAMKRATSQTLEAINVENKDIKLLTIDL
jgi:short-subunit dehydrogenase